MSHHLTDSSGFGEAEHLAVRALELGTAAYALGHAARGTPIGEEGDYVAQAARTGGNFVIAAFLWHFVVLPYLIVTAILFSLPLLAVRLIVGLNSTPGTWVEILTGLICIYLWFRYAIKRWLWRRFIRRVDATLSGRTLDEPVGPPSASVTLDPAYVTEYAQRRFARGTPAIDNSQPTLFDDAAYPL